MLWAFKNDLVHQVFDGHSNAPIVRFQDKRVAGDYYAIFNCRIQDGSSICANIAQLHGGPYPRQGYIVSKAGPGLGLSRSRAICGAWQTFAATRREVSRQGFTPKT